MYSNFFKENLDCNLTALDISKDALSLAKTNAQLNNTEITFINKSMTDNLTNNYDIIISNPPYISYDGFVEEKVKTMNQTLLYLLKIMDYIFIKKY